MTSPREPKPLTIFTKPKHPRYNWDRLNAEAHERAVNEAIEHDRRVREGRKRVGFPSLKECHNRTGIRFGNLPPRDRPAAERELTRLVNRSIERTGQLPSHAKLASLIGNATFIVKHCRSGNRAKWRMRHITYRRVLDRLDAALAREGTPAAPTAKPHPKSSWRGLGGI